MIIGRVISSYKDKATLGYCNVFQMCTAGRFCAFLYKSTAILYIPVK